MHGGGHWRGKLLQTQGTVALVSYRETRSRFLGQGAQWRPLFRFMLRSLRVMAPAFYVIGVGSRGGLDAACYVVQWSRQCKT